MKLLCGLSLNIVSASVSVSPEEFDLFLMFMNKENICLKVQIFVHISSSGF